MTTEKGTGKGAAAKADANVTERLPFLLLGLDLPPPPLFKDAMEKNIIPQARVRAVAFSRALMYRLALAYSRALMYSLR